MSYIRKCLLTFIGFFLGWCFQRLLKILLSKVFFIHFFSGKKDIKDLKKEGQNTTSKKKSIDTMLPAAKRKKRVVTNSKIVSKNSFEKKNFTSPEVLVGVNDASSSFYFGDEPRKMRKSKKNNIVRKRDKSGLIASDINVEQKLSTSSLNQTTCHNENQKAKVNSCDLIQFRKDSLTGEKKRPRPVLSSNRRQVVIDVPFLETDISSSINADLNHFVKIWQVMERISPQEHEDLIYMLCKYLLDPPSYPSANSFSIALSNLYPDFSLSNSTTVSSVPERRVSAHTTAMSIKFSSEINRKGSSISKNISSVDGATNIKGSKSSKTSTLSKNSNVSITPEAKSLVSAVKGARPQRKGASLFSYDEVNVDISSNISSFVSPRSPAVSISSQRISIPPFRSKELLTLQENRCSVFINRQNAFLLSILNVLENECTSVTVIESILSLLYELAFRGGKVCKHTALSYVHHGLTKICFQLITRYKDSEEIINIFESLASLLVLLENFDRRFSVQARLLGFIPVALNVMNSVNISDYLDQSINLSFKAQRCLLICLIASSKNDLNIALMIRNQAIPLIHAILKSFLGCKIASQWFLAFLSVQWLRRICETSEVGLEEASNIGLIQCLLQVHCLPLKDWNLLVEIITVLRYLLTLGNGYMQFCQYGGITVFIRYLIPKLVDFAPEKWEICTVLVYRMLGITHLPVMTDIDFTWCDPSRKKESNNNNLSQDLTYVLETQLDPLPDVNNESLSLTKESTSGIAVNSDLLSTPISKEICSSFESSDTVATKSKTKENFSYYCTQKKSSSLGKNVEIIRQENIVSDSTAMTDTDGSKAMNIPLKTVGPKKVILDDNQTIHLPRNIASQVPQDIDADPTMWYFSPELYSGVVNPESELSQSDLNSIFHVRPFFSEFVDTPRECASKRNSHFNREETSDLSGIFDPIYNISPTEPLFQHNEKDIIRVFCRHLLRLIFPLSSKWLRVVYDSSHSTSNANLLSLSTDSNLVTNLPLPDRHIEVSNRFKSSSPFCALLPLSYPTPPIYQNNQYHTKQGGLYRKSAPYGSIAMETDNNASDLLSQEDNDIISQSILVDWNNIACEKEKSLPHSQEINANNSFFQNQVDEDEETRLACDPLSFMYKNSSSNSKSTDFDCCKDFPDVACNPSGSVSLSSSSNQSLRKTPEIISPVSKKFSEDFPCFRTGSDDLEIYNLPPLMFDSHFESGNLRYAVQVLGNEYDLLLQPDINTNHHLQWFFFEVDNVKPGGTYYFNILNLEKDTSSFSNGQKVLLFSPMATSSHQNSWRRWGDSYTYFSNSYSRRDRVRVDAAGDHFTGYLSALPFDQQIDSPCGSPGLREEYSSFRKNEEENSSQANDKKNCTGNFYRNDTKSDFLKAENAFCPKKANDVYVKANITIQSATNKPKRRVKKLCLEPKAHIPVFDSSSPVSLGRNGSPKSAKSCSKSPIFQFSDSADELSTNSTMECLELTQSYCTLSFRIKFPDNEGRKFYIASGYPYLYKDMLRDLKDWLSLREYYSFIFAQRLCYTSGGNILPLLTITSMQDEHTKTLYSHEEILRRPVCFISARVHPGETNSSFMLRGLVRFLLHPTNPHSCFLRKQCVWKVVPMINPDGVINGNHRCSLYGFDLNRFYEFPNRQSNSNIYFIKALMRQITMKERRQVILYGDFHGHSRCNDFLLYGCKPLHCPVIEKYGVMPEKVFSFLLGKLAPFLSLERSTNKMEKMRKGAGRIVMYKEFGIRWSFTLEASVMGGKGVDISPITPRGSEKNVLLDEHTQNHAPLTLGHYNIGHFEAMGMCFARTMFYLIQGFKGHIEPELEKTLQELSTSFRVNNVDSPYTTTLSNMLPFGNLDSDSSLSTQLNSLGSSLSQFPLMINNNDKSISLLPLSNSVKINHIKLTNLSPLIQLEISNTGQCFSDKEKQSTGALCVYGTSDMPSQNEEVSYCSSFNEILLNSVSDALRTSFLQSLPNNASQETRMMQPNNSYINHLPTPVVLPHSNSLSGLDSPYSLSLQPKMLSNSSTHDENILEDIFYKSNSAKFPKTAESNWGSTNTAQLENIMNSSSSLPAISIKQSSYSHVQLSSTSLTVNNK